MGLSGMLSKVAILRIKWNATCSLQVHQGGARGRVHGLEGYGKCQRCASGCLLAGGLTGRAVARGGGAVLGRDWHVSQQATLRSSASQHFLCEQRRVPLEQRVDWGVGSKNDEGVSPYGMPLVRRKY